MILVLEHMELNAPSTNTFQMSLMSIMVYPSPQGLRVINSVLDFGGVSEKDILNALPLMAYVLLGIKPIEY